MGYHDREAMTELDLPTADGNADAVHGGSDPRQAALMIEGVAYHVQSHERINMVMTERGGRWVCLMGKVPVDRLAELALAHFPCLPTTQTRLRNLAFSEVLVAGRRAAGHRDLAKSRCWRSRHPLGLL